MSEKEQKQPLDMVFRPNATFKLSYREMLILSEIIAPFEWMSSILKKAKDEAANTGMAVMTYEEDYQKNPDGSLKTDVNGRPMLLPDFWEKHQEKVEEKKTILVDSLGNTN